LNTFQKSEIIDTILLVVGKGQVSYAKDEIVRKYEFSKVNAVVEGGEERYDSVWQGLKAIDKERGISYIFIHDGARPFVNEEILRRGYDCAERFRACVAGMPSKDTVKLADKNDFAVSTPERKYVWTIQTPQIFEKDLIVDAYSKLMGEEHSDVTDDAMAVERTMGVPVKMFRGSYENIKITTPEDLSIAKVFLELFFQ
jgi:2-C-methyl-D-erythritol 4-phosphate cytidylyltransferase